MSDSNDVKLLRRCVQDVESEFPNASSSRKIAAVERDFHNSMRNEKPELHSEQIRQKFRQALADNPALFKRCVEENVDQTTEKFRQFKKDNPSASSEETLKNLFVNDPAATTTAIKGQATRGQRERILAAEPAPSSVIRSEINEAKLKLNEKLDEVVKARMLKENCGYTAALNKIMRENENLRSIKL